MNLSKWYLLALNLISTIFVVLIFNKINLSSCICMSLLCNGIMLILGKINNLILYRYSK